MICPRCHSNNAPGARFCSQCRQPLAPQAAPGPAGAPQTANSAPAWGGAANATGSQPFAGTGNGAAAFGTGNGATTAGAGAPTSSSFDQLNHKWTLKQVLFERGLFPIAFGIVAGYYLCGQLNAFAGLYGALIYFPMVIVGMPLIIILSFLAGTLLMRIWLAITRATHVEKETVDYCRSHGIDPRELLRSRWYSAYGTAIGLVAWSILGSIVAGLTGQVMLVFVVYPFAWLLARGLNKIMFARTQTNKLVIDALNAGRYDSLFRDDKEKRATLKGLESRNYSTVRSSLDAVRLSRTLTKLSIIGAIIGFIISFFIFRMFDKEIKAQFREAQESMANGVSGAFSGGAGGSNQGGNQADDERQRNAAWQQQQEEKRARDKWYAEDQARRNQASAEDRARRNDPEGARAYASAAANHQRTADRL